MSIINASDAAALAIRKGMNPQFVATLKEIFTSIRFNSEKGFYNATLPVEAVFYSDVLRILENLEYKVIVPSNIPRGVVQAVMQIKWDHKKDVYLWEVLKEALGDDQTRAT